MNMSSRIAILTALAVAIALVMFGKQHRSGEDAGSSGPVGKPRLIDLGADKCIPCKAMAPILEELRAEFSSSFDVVFIDVWKNPEAAEPYAINLIPTQLFLDVSGRELWRHEGFLGKEEILAKWRELGVLD